MIEFTLPTMTCNHCVRAITETVRRLDADAALTFNLAEHRVKIDTQEPEARLREALSEEGYTPA
jgi:copper chaperone